MALEAINPVLATHERTEPWEINYAQTSEKKVAYEEDSGRTGMSSVLETKRRENFKNEEMVNSSCYSLAEVLIHTKKWVVDRARRTLQDYLARLFLCRGDGEIKVLRSKGINLESHKINIRAVV